ncbi:hypothetical protein CURE108131_25065 [Cupriavidus respiraculi]|uniref:Uncharacterized protein n=1 Tax=Cupriavidus respiraculi TaxID=195930 RepID=A0ABM8XV03_9BURK|nr:hypothetical protein [Cupriavidus respiraculi]CAG9184225.1 hypothetical protein LMG21510_05044 [Cupriavidus respiraculi]
MTTFVIDDREWTAMRAVDHLARDLYDALRRSMDYKTGIVGGPAKAISWWSLREDTEVPGRPGVKAYKPSEQQLRRRMAQLEKIGLVESIGNKLQLKFRLLLARTASLASEKADTPSTPPEASRKASKDKAVRGYAQMGSGPKAGTHQESDKTVKTSPPTPSRLRRERDDKAIDPPAPAVREADNPKGDETPIAAQGRLEPSEQRHEPAAAVGGGPSAPNPEEEREATIEWEAGLHWPRGLTQRQRAYVARRLRPLGAALGQRVLDEWRGANQAGGIHAPWAFFNALVAKAQQPDWDPIYADDVAHQRELVRANRAAQEAAHAARVGDLPKGPMPKGMLAKLIKRRAR